MTTKSGPVDELSFDVNAALASAASAPATPADDAPETEEQNEADDQSQDDSGADAPHPFFKDSDKSADDAEDDASAQDAGDEDFWEIPAYGKVHKVSKNDHAKIQKLLSAGLAAPQAHTKAAKLAQENKRLARELKDADTARERSKIFDKLEAVKDDENELYRIITGGKSLDAVIDARVQKTLKWQNALPEERVALEAEERDKMMASQLQRAQAEVAVERQRNQQILETAEQKDAHSLAYPEFQTVFKALGIKDPVQAQEVASDLWDIGWSRIGKLAAQAKAEGTELELTSALLRTTFRSAAARFGATSKAAAKEKVAKIVERKSAAATEKAGLAATKNYKSPASIAKDLEGLSPTQVFERLKHRLKPTKVR